MSTLNAAGRGWPDLDLDVPCCMGSAAQGPHACTCWQPIYTLDQQDVDTSAQPATQTAMCGDCAYRPGSPERLEDPHASVQGLDELHVLAATGRPFYCHTGMRLVLAWRHPTGAVLQGEDGEYDPPIRAGVPYQADGTPALICGGWAAVRRRHDSEATP